MRTHVDMLEKLAKQTAIYGISTILGRMLSYLLTPFYTRIFGLDSYGIITDVYALIPFALVVLTLGMESSYFRFAAKADESAGDVTLAKSRLFTTTWGITSLAAIAFFTLITVFRVPVSALMGEAYSLNPTYVVIVAAIVMLDVCSAIPFARLREQKRALKFVELKLLNILLQVLFALLFWAAGLFGDSFGVGWAFVANLLASLITTLAVCAVTARSFPRIDWILLGNILAYSMPLLLSGVAGTAGEFLDRQLIKYLTPADSLSQLGIYGAITKIAVVMTLFTQMYRLAAEPFFLASFKKSDFLALNAAAMKYYVLVSMLIFLGIALFRDLFALIVGASFREGIFILPVVLGANVMSGMWLNLSFWYKREEKTRFALWVTLTGVAASALLGIILIPRWGYYGAAWSRFGAEAAMVTVSILLNRIFFPTPYQWSRIVELVLVACAGYMLSEYCTPQCIAGKYTLNTAIIIAYMAYAIRREHIDLRQMFRSILKRNQA